MKIVQTSEKEVRITALKKEIEKTFGCKIVSYRECVTLSSAIYLKTGQRLNTNTLRRFFGLINYDFSPSNSTLNILANYCGFPSFGHIALDREHLSGNGFQNEINDLVDSFFEVEVDEQYAPFYYSLLLRNVNSFLSKNVHLEKTFHTAIAEKATARFFYFEKFINLDGLNSFYGNGLQAYIKNVQSKEAQILGHILLVYKYWLSKNNSQLKEHFDQVMTFSLSSDSSPELIARFYASMLFYANSKGLDTISILEEVRQIYNSMRPDVNAYPGIASFELIFGQSLALTNHYIESLFYLGIAKEVYFRNEQQYTDPFYQSITLYEAWVYFKLDDLENVDLLLSILDPSHFNYLSKKLDSILYLTMKGAVQEENADSKMQIHSLLQETGFSRLKELMHECYNEQ